MSKPDRDGWMTQMHLTVALYNLKKVPHPPGCTYHSLYNECDCGVRAAIEAIERLLERGEVKA